MKLKSFALITLLALQSAGLGSLATAQTCKDDFKRDPYLAGSNYVAYPGPKGSLTPAPAGMAAATTSVRSTLMSTNYFSMLTPPMC